MIIIFRANFFYSLNFPAKTFLFFEFLRQNVFIALNKVKANFIVVKIMTQKRKQRKNLSGLFVYVIGVVSICTW